jgi:glycosyltransferase involved in cell wall biosynthesis
VIVPLVSVLLPCFDAERFLSEALRSVLVQTHDELELIALDDGSRDRTAEILDAAAGEDGRIRVLSTSSNRGLIETLNVGIREARGDFIARMDADDVADPTRIESQLATLLGRPELGAVGAGVDLIDERGRKKPSRPPRCIEPGAVRFMAVLATPIQHPTLLARTDVLRAHGYRRAPETLHTEDYDLFARLLEAGIKLGNVNARLLSRRIVTTSVSRRHEPQQVMNFVACARRHLDQEVSFSLSEPGHRVLVNRMDRDVTSEDLAEGLLALDRLEAQFRAREPASAGEIRGIAEEQRADILIQATLKGNLGARMAALRLAGRYANRLRSSRTLAYVAGKARR